MDLPSQSRDSDSPIKSRRSQHSASKSKFERRVKMSRLVNLTALLLLVLACLQAASGKPHEEMTKDHATELANECKAETGATDGK